ncbi:MAG: carbohydrate kinase [Actinomycetota bacterium]|nr:carbohydrate kinase [Actinomycetota bacterium]
MNSGPEAGRGYALALGEALVDMIEADCRGEPVYRPAPGGSPFNVAIGLARLGVPVEFVGSFGSDPLGARLRAYLADHGVRLTGSPVVDVPTSLAVTTFEGPDPRFTFYGSPHSFGLLDPERLDDALVAGARAVHCGSISLLEEPVYRAALRAFSLEGPIRTIDPNVRPSLVADFEAYRRSLEALFARADVVKLSADDAQALYSEEGEGVLRRIRALGDPQVVLTLASRGCLALIGEELIEVPGRPVEAVDTTGAGDAFVAAVIAGLMEDDAPPTADRWERILEFAVAVSALTCCAPGGATAIPTREEVAERFEVVL